MMWLVYKLDITTRLIFVSQCFLGLVFFSGREYNGNK